MSRVLAEDVRADLPVPGFDTTAMDGWAVRAEEVGRAPALLAAAGVSGAGSVPAALPSGSAWKVMTGAPMPPGSDAVVPVEDAALVDERIRPSRRRPETRARTSGAAARSSRRARSSSPREEG